MPNAPSDSSISQIKVTLTGTRPPIWRRLLVPQDFTLTNLHTIIQIAFGWTDSHLHEFRVGRQAYGTKEPGEFDFGGPPKKSEKKTLVGDVLGQVGAKANYTYDFGDDWQHAITVEKVLPRDPAVSYPMCTAGKLQGPPEDCGGVPGYYHLLEAVSDPDHPDHEEMCKWRASDADPLAFSADEVNAALGRLRRKRR